MRWKRITIAFAIYTSPPPAAEPLLKEKPLKGSAEMKKIVLTILNALLIIPFLVLFRKGGNVAIFMLPVWLIMTMINTKFAQNIRQLILYNVFLTIFATIGTYICGKLYFKYVYWDSMGEAVVQLEMIVEVIYIAILTGIESRIKYIESKERE